MCGERPAINPNCDCVQVNCPIHGQCITCIENHKRHKTHVPECMQNILRDRIGGLCALVEFKTIDTRPPAR
jgi:hypothetical protein